MKSEERKNCPDCGEPLGDLVLFDTKTGKVDRVLIPNFYCINCKLTLQSIISKMYEEQVYQE